MPSLPDRRQDPTMLKRLEALPPKCATFARYALRHLHKPLVASQRRRSGAAAGFRILPNPPFLNFTEEPKMTGTRSGLVILTALLLSGSAVVAQQAGKPCAGDIKTLCAGIQPGEGRIKGCIKSHLTDLSPTCNDRVLTVAVTGKVCKTDVTNLCGGVVPQLLFRQHRPEAEVAVQDNSAPNMDKVCGNP
jgi:hypothetical protein